MNMTKFLKNITTMLALATLVACSSGGSCPPNLPAQEAGKLVFVAPSILPSLANKTGINYMGVYNPSKTTINGISYNLGQQVGAGNSITLDSASAKACATIPAQSSCFLKLSVPESTIAGGAVVTASNSSGAEAATPLAIGVQQVPYTESANANGVGLYFYPKAQYGANSVPFILVTAVIQSPNVGNINTIQLVDESGNVIPDQTVISNNSGAGKAALQMGDVVEISLPIPQGINLTQNFKVQTSSQSLVTTTLNSIATKLNLKSLEASSNGNIGSTTYTLTTQGNNINLQLTPNQVYLTQTNPVQYGYLYNIGDLTASQIEVTSASPNVKVTVADLILNGQRVIKVTYELINTTVAPASNAVLVTAQNPAGQTQTSTGGISQNINPLPVPTPSPTPTPTPTVSPTPGPIPTSPSITLVLANSEITIGEQTTVNVILSVAPLSPTTVTFNANNGNVTFANPASCVVPANQVSCSAAVTITGTTAGTSSIIASALGYSNSPNISIQVFNGIFMYFTNTDDNTISRCNLGVNGALSNCTNYSNSTFSNLLSSPVGVAIQGSTMLVTNIGGNNITSCQIDNTGLPNNCSTPTTTGANFYQPNFMSISNGNIFISNAISPPNGVYPPAPAAYLGTVSRCAIDSNGGLSECANFNTSSLPGANFIYSFGVFATSDYLLVSNAFSQTGLTPAPLANPWSTVSKCSLSNGVISGCTTFGNDVTNSDAAVQLSGALFNSPNNLTLYNNHILVLNYAYAGNSPSTFGSLTTCSIASNGNFSNCTNSLNNEDGSGLLNGPQDLLINNNFLYIANYNSNEITRCDISINAQLNNCINIASPTGANFNGLGGFAILKQ